MKIALDSTNIPECVNEMLGRQFFRLKIVEFSHRERTATGKLRYIVRCICDCGDANVLRRHDQVKSGVIKSCGCYHDIAPFKHGDGTPGHEAPEYKSWMSAKRRCVDPSTTGYVLYGGKGIKFYDEWLGEDGYKNFLAYMGRQPSAEHNTLDRYPDRKGNYYPGNVRWASRKQQAENRSTTRFVSAFGNMKCVAEWARLTEISESRLYRYLNKHGTSNIEEYIKAHSLFVDF